MLGTNLSEAESAELCSPLQHPDPQILHFRSQDMQCPVCHNEVASQTAFCNHCGAPLGAAPATPTYAVQPAVTTGSGLSETAAAAISYITIIPAIIFLAIEPYNKMPFVRFHCFQSIGLCVVWFAIWMVITIMQMAVHFIPFLGFLFIFVHLLVALGMFIVWLMAIIKASKGEWYKLPFIGDFAEKQAHS
jgi:uncharacterized membrane protein